MSASAEYVGLMPAEWEPHDATWIAWPHQQTDWPGRFSSIADVYAEIVQALAQGGELLQILVHNEEILNNARLLLQQRRVDPESYHLHIVPNDRSWLRDSAPTAVRSADNKILWIKWQFNGWAKYEDHLLDQQVPDAIAKISGLPLTQAFRPDNSGEFVLEGGAIETDGEGTLLVTEECLLSKVQERNPALSKAGYEEAFRRFLGIKQTIWLQSGIEGDDTHGHIDDLARFASSGCVFLAYEEKTGFPNHLASVRNLERLQSATDARGRKLDIIKLPMPSPLLLGQEILPASYANFYIANEAVLVPIFNDQNDSLALDIIGEHFPKRRIMGIKSLDLVLGLGTLHCLTQQQPR